MPKESIALGGVNEVLPLTNIASRLIALCEKRTTWPPH
jgi:chemotaxis response regulator CheB